MSALKKATGATVTGMRNYQNQFYRQDHTPSSLKIQLGEILFCWLSQNQQGELRQAFETKLKQFVDLKYAGKQLCQKESEL